MSSLLSLACCSIASTKGFDECYIENPSVVELAPYSLPRSTPQGLCAVKSKLNAIHRLLDDQHYQYRYLHHYDHSNIVCIQRFHKRSPYTVLCISYLDYKRIEQNDAHLSFSIDGKIIGQFLAATMKYDEQQLKASIDPSHYHLRGIDSQDLFLDYSEEDELHFCEYSYNEGDCTTTLHTTPRFTPGSFVIYLVQTNSTFLSSSHTNKLSTKTTRFLSYSECILSPL